MTPRGTARGFATVSSTAALEAMAMDRPTLINLVFEGSGCPGTLDDLRRSRLFQPDPDWLEPTTSIVLSRSMERLVHSSWLWARDATAAARRAAH